MNEVKRRQSEVDEYTKRVAVRRLEAKQAIDALVTAETMLALAHDRLERARDAVCCPYHASGAPESKHCGEDKYIGAGSI